MGSIQQKTKLDSLLHQLEICGWEPGLTDRSYELIVNAGFSRSTAWVAAIAAEIAVEEHPLTLRGLFYRTVSAGVFPDTCQSHYNKLARIVSKLRTEGVIPFSWIVDNMRSTQKPSSWSGVEAFIDTVKDAYRRDFWSSLPNYVHVFCEKDAIAGVISSVTREYDVSLSPCRGYASLSYIHEITSLWNKIEKPIHAFYLGDFDPSGMDIERNLMVTLTAHCDRPFTWTRLGVNDADFAQFDLLELDVKHTDNRSKSFVAEYGERCAEVDALPPSEIRRRVKGAITQFIPTGAWEKLQGIEQAERETLNRVLDSLGGGGQ